LQIDSKNVVRFSNASRLFGRTSGFASFADAPRIENDSQSGWRIPQIVRRVKRKKRFFPKNFQIYLFSPKSPAFLSFCSTSFVLFLALRSRKSLKQAPLNTRRNRQNRQNPKNVKFAAKPTPPPKKNRY